MAIRTIDAPGIEMHEIDKSQYSPAMTGTKVLVTGFANSGEDYIPMIFTSKSAWLNYYGEPDNEAERYFYAASMEVLNQNGVVNCCKLPYENEARDKFVGQKYSLSLRPDSLTTVSESLAEGGELHSLDAVIKQSPTYNKDLVDYFMNEINVTDSEDKETLVKSKLTPDSQMAETVLDGGVNTQNRSDGKVVTSEDNYFTTYCFEKGVDGESYMVHDDISSFSSLQDSFSNKMTKAQLISYVEEMNTSTLGIMPKLNAYYKVTTEIDKPADITSDVPISAQVSSMPILSCMGKTMYDVYNLIKTHPESLIYQAFTNSDEFDALSSFNTSAAYKRRTVRELCEAITELSTIGADGNPINLDITPVTLRDYYVVLDKILKDGFYSTISAADFEITQNISILLAYNLDVDTVTLTAINKYKFPREAQKDPEIKDFLVDAIDGLVISDPETPEVFSDDIFAYFTSRQDVKKVTYGLNNSLCAMYVDGIQAFQVLPVTDDFGAISADVFERINKSQYNLVVSEDENWDDAMTYYNTLRTNAEVLRANVIEDIRRKLMFNEIKEADNTVSSFLEIKTQGTPSLYDITQIDEYRTDESRVATNTILVVDKTRHPYVKIPEDKAHKDDKREMIGIIPIITTAANALYAQSLINVDDGNVTDYETIKTIKTLDCSKNAYKFLGKEYNTFNVLSADPASVAVISKRFNNEHVDGIDTADDFFDSLALEANNYFSPIALQADGGFDRENMKKIGLVVVKAYLDASEGNKISFQTVESFVGSLDRTAKNPNTGATTFIDTIVNEQSEYVNIFTNCIPTDSLRQEFKEKVDIITMPHETAHVASMGFYEGMCEEDIDISESILKALDIVYDKVTDINERDLDIVVDGGISNIAQFIKTVYGKKGFYDPASPDAALWKCKKDNDVKMWKTVVMKLDNFCKNIRKDCMFIADGPRPYCLQGQKKIVRPSKPKNTIDVDILPYTKYLTGINTSYGAGYCDWFQIADEFSGDYFWCPPSIKACGVYIYTDLNYEYWDAPAGLNRGVIAALDVAFSPTNKQAGQIYTKNWNYAINYPQDGIVLEGQKTLQTKPTALDRVNVRRLMLRLERATYKVLRYVVYEGNTAYTRQRTVDLLDPIFKQAKIGGGLYDYKIICDETVNTPETIDRNEFHIKIGLKPTKTIEFIMVDFVLLSTGASWSEML